MGLKKFTLNISRLKDLDHDSSYKNRVDEMIEDYNNFNPIKKIKNYPKEFNYNKWSDLPRDIQMMLQTDKRYFIRCTVSEKILYIELNDGRAVGPNTSKAHYYESYLLDPMLTFSYVKEVVVVSVK